MKKVYIVTLLTFSTLIASGQDKRFDFGFFMELLKRINRLEQTGNDFNNITARNNIGFGLGSNLYYIVNERLKIRLTLGVDFEKETLQYYSSTAAETKISEVGFVTSGLHPIIKANKKMPINIIAGLTPYYGLKDNKDNKKDMEFKKIDLTGDIGLSYAISLKTLKVMPEVKYSKSFTNASVDNSIYGQSIESYYRDRINLSIYFFTF